jgi:PTS system sucrose-specific IIC component
MKKSRIADLFGVIGDVFNPLIPAFLTAGIASGFAILLIQIFPAIETHRRAYAIYSVLILINKSFTPYMTTFVGFYTCKRLGSPNPILGAMLGMITGLSEIEVLASILNLSKILYKGAGGVTAAFVGAVLVTKLEIRIHRWMPKSIGGIITPLLTLFLIVVPYILVIMPFAGFLSDLLCKGLEALGSFESFSIKILLGFLCAAAFLPINIFGLQHGIIALYPIQLEKYGYITLYPVFAMAGAGQVGTGFAVALIAKRAHNTAFSHVSLSATIPGMMGVAAPLLYGVTLSCPKAFLASCIGAGVGGAFMMTVGVVSTGWGPSGLLAVPMMTGGTGSATMSMMFYIAGWAISVITGFFVTLALVRPKTLSSSLA